MLSSKQEDILVLLKNRDKRGLELAYDLYFSGMLVFGISIVKNVPAAEDHCQETFVSLWRDEPTFDTIKQLEGFLFTVVKNKSLNYLKREKSHEQAVKHLTYQEMTQMVSNNQIIESLVIADIAKALQSLPDRQAKIGSMLYQKGMTVGEVAKELGTSSQNVSMQKSTMLNTLRSMMEGNEISAG